MARTNGESLIAASSICLRLNPPFPTLPLSTLVPPPSAWPKEPLHHKRNTAIALVVYWAGALTFASYLDRYHMRQYRRNDPNDIHLPWETDAITKSEHH